jgi:hypothetical protein
LGKKFSTEQQILTAVFLIIAEFKRRAELCLNDERAPQGL